MINIIWIGIIIILMVIINDKNKELNKLKKENNLLHINIKNMATILNEKNKSKQEIIPDIKQQQEEVLETKTIPKEKDRNNLILITGSILIVLAAIL
jgi:DNA repair exonuclease SbcCD nuclease subunit